MRDAPDYPHPTYAEWKRRRFGQAEGDVCGAWVCFRSWLSPLGKAAKQRVNLPLGLFDCAVGMDDGVGELFFLRQGHLSVDAPLCLRSVEPVALSKSLNLCFARNGNDPNGIEQRLHAAFIEQRDVADDKAFRRVEGIKLSGDFAQNEGMQNGVQLIAFLGIGKERAVPSARRSSESPQNTPSPKA